MHTIISLIEQSYLRFANRPALRHKVSGAWQEITYTALWTASDRIAAGLRKSGFREGEKAALVAPSSPQWMMVYLGILKAGGVVVPVDKELKATELRHILAHCEAPVIFSAASHLPTLHDIAHELTHLRRVVTLDASPQQGHKAEKSQSSIQAKISSLDELPADAPFSPVPRAPADTAVILYTSGTTGRSKGAMLSHANIVSNIGAASSHLDVDDSIHTLSFLPINHVFEQVCGILLPLSLGGAVSFCESLKKLGDNLGEVKPTLLVGVPAVYRMLLDRVMKQIEARTLSRLLFSSSLTRPLVTAKVRKAFGSGTIFVSGGAALDPAVADGLTKLGLTIFQGYGITETSPVVAAERHGQTRPGSVGRALAGIEVRIDNPNADMVGEILVRGPNVMQGYYRDPESTAEVLIDGWYRTGDLGRLDPDGFLHICGRVKNLIVTPNGKNIYPEEVENELVKSRYIAEAIVYGFKAAPTEEEIHAVVYPEKEALDELGRIRGEGALTEEEIEALIRREVTAACAALAGYKRVRKVTISEEEFPKTTTRKIKRFLLAEGLCRKN